MAVLFLVILSVSVMWIASCIISKMWFCLKYILDIILVFAMFAGIFFFIMYNINIHANDKTQQELQEILQTIQTMGSQLAPNMTSLAVGSITSFFNVLGMLR